MPYFKVACRSISVNRGNVVSKLSEERVEFIKTPMNISDDVERPMLIFSIVPEWLALNCNLLNLFRRREFKDMSKAFALEVPN